MESLKDSLITVSQGGGAIALSLWTTLPEIVRLGILIATFIHIAIKIKKELQ
jgi:hypothetical protein